MKSPTLSLSGFLRLSACVLLAAGSALEAGVTTYTNRTTFTSATPASVTNINIDSAATGNLTYYNTSAGFTLSGTQFVELVGGSYIEPVIRAAYASNYQGWNGNPTVIGGSSDGNDYIQVNLPAGTRGFGCDLYTVRGGGGNGAYVRFNLSSGETYDFLTANKPNLVFAGVISTTDLAWVRIRITANGDNPCVSSVITAAAPPPAAVTTAATAITVTTAAFNGTVNANNESTTVTFDWGLTTSYGSSVTASPSLVTGTSTTPVGFSMGGLTPGTTYHYRTRGVSIGGTNLGGDVAFTTLASTPVAAFTVTPNPAAPNQTLSFDGTGSSHTNMARSIVLYEWDWNYDGITFNTAATGSTATHAYPLFGTYTAALRVTDNDSPAKTAITTHVVTINQGNLAPFADAGGPYTILLGQGATLNASASSDPNAAAGDSITSYQWDLNNDGAYDAIGSSPSFSPSAATLAGHGIDHPATYTIKLKVTDSLGATGTATTTLTVQANLAPVADAGGPYTILLGQGATLDASVSSDPNTGQGDSITSYQWDLNNDGAYDASGSSPSFSPSAATLAGYGIDHPATYTIKLKVTDSLGATGTATTTLTVQANLAPTFTSADTIPNTSNGFTATGLTLGTITLGFAPATGTSLTLVNNTSRGFITGQFSNLTQGQTVILSYNGVNYTFVANYFGGTGNDLVLVWKDTQPWGWGYNYYGQLGNNSTTQSLVPVAVSNGGVLSGKTVVAVAAGYYHSLALCSDGTLAAWGYNGNGQLGNNSTTNSPVPVAVVQSGVLSGKTVVAVAAGDSHSVALCSDGTLAAWGYNGNGQLGNNSTTQSNLPVAVVQSGVLAGKTVVAVAAGNSHSVALCSDGSLAAWGANGNGQLGNNSTTNSPVPVAVVQSGVLAGKTVVAVAAGATHSLALCSDGTLAAWGYNGNGQLGNNSTSSSLVPVAVSNGGVLSGKTVVAVAAGNLHSLALCSDGTLAAWGYNGNGQLGNNSTTNSSVPVAVSTSTLAAGQRFTRVAYGSSAYHSLALVASPPTPVVTTLAATAITGTSATLNGTVNPKGNNTSVFFDYGLTTTYGNTLAATPELVTGSGVLVVNTTLTGLSPGTGYHFRVRGTSNAGTGTGTDQVFTTSLPNVTFTFNTATDVPVTAEAVTIAGATVTLSLNFAPQTGTELRVVTNTGLSFINGTFSNLAQGQTLTLNYNGQNYNFVANYYGGTGNDLVLVWKDARPWAWGNNSSGQLGNNTTTNSPVPVETVQSGVLAGKTVVAVAAGSNHSVALCSDGTLAAWGNNSSGQLGNNSTSSSLVPVAVVQSGVLAGKTVVAVAAGDSHSLTLCSDGTLAAWGYNGNGQLGNNSTSSSLVPVAVSSGGVLSGKTVVAVAAGASHSLALCSDGTLAAWGSNAFGQLGNNSMSGSLVPVAVTQSGVLSGKTVVAVVAGFFYSMALCSDGTLAAWGYNAYGQLGNNSTTNSLVPVLVSTSPLAAGQRFTRTASGSASLHSIALVASPPPPLPTAATLAATSITTTGATLNGTVTANNNSTAVTFDYGTSTAYGSTIAGTPTPITGSSTTAVSAVLTGLIPGTTYHYRVTGTSVAGTASGSDFVFTTISNNANLASLTLSDGTLNPSFASNTLNYSTTVANSVSSLTLTPAVQHPAATVKVNNVIANGSANVSLSIGLNSITVLVTAQDGTENTYTITVTRQTAVETWRQTYFGTSNNSGNAADNADPDGDGLSNYLEWACNLNPTTSGTLDTPLARNGATFEFTYTRSVAAVNAGAVFTVEWSDTLPGTSWSSAGVTEQILSDNGTAQQVKASVPAGSSGRRFVHLKVSGP